MTDPIRLLGLCGSLRRASYNGALLAAAADLAPRAVSLRVHDIGDLPLFNEDVEALGDPAPVAALKAAIARADALLVATPEYNYGVPGPLKNALDWASRPDDASVLAGKPVALLGASLGRMGTVRAQLALRQLFVGTGSVVMPKPELFVPSAWRSFGEGGALVDDALREQLREFMAAVAAWARRHAAPAAAAA
jgi:chromate reductase